jgi:pilus assembly protein CpaE
MNDKLTILLIDSDEQSRRSIRNVVKELPDVQIKGETQSLSDGQHMARKIKPDILILELPSDFERALRTAEQIKSDSPGTLIFITSKSKDPEIIIRAMRAGAQEFLIRPIEPSELKKAIEKAQKILKQKETPKVDTGKIITVFSKKGGVGVTTIAINLALGLTRLAHKEGKENKDKTVIVDLDLQLGDVTSFMNLMPNFTIVDACNRNGDIDAVKLDASLLRAPSGLRVLGEPKDPMEAEIVTPAHIHKILSQLKSRFPYVVIDTPHTFDNKTQEIFEISNYILLVTVSNISALRATKKTLDFLKNLGYGEEKVKVIANRIGKKDRIRTDEMEKALHFPVSWQIPNNYPVVIDSINSGLPLVGDNKSSNVADSLIDLAEEIANWSKSTSLLNKK